jgi:pilus assembly protein CpaB
VGRRLALLIAAVLVAAVGTSLVFFYVQRADDRAIADQQPVTVLVAKLSITPGTRVIDAANAGSFETKELPQAAVAPGALSSTDPVREMVALTTIFPGQQLLSGMFGATAGSVSTIAIPTGQIAASFSFQDPQRVAGFVQPGSEVAIFTSASDPTIKGPFQQFTKLLLPRVTVIAVGPTTITPPTDPSKANTEALPRALITFALTQKQAEKLIFASSQGGGSLYLGLLTDKSTITTRGSGVNGATVFR